MANVADSAHRRELSKGRGTIHRGYYCLSPIKDRVIGGCKRGRLVSKLPPKADAVYEYFFNESNEMTLVIITLLNKDRCIILKANSLKKGQCDTVGYP